MQRRSFCWEMSETKLKHHSVIKFWTKGGNGKLYKNKFWPWLQDMISYFKVKMLTYRLPRNCLQVKQVLLHYDLGMTKVSLQWIPDCLHWNRNWPEKKLHKKNLTITRTRLPKWNPCSGFIRHPLCPKRPRHKKWWQQSLGILKVQTSEFYK